jgi:hypothetical protein
MPIRRRNKNKKKFIIWAILIVLLIGMIWSFSNNPVFTEIVLYP